MEMQDFGKARAQRLHAQRRARERFGISLSNRMYGEWIRMIQEGTAIFVDRQSQRLTRWRVPINEEESVVVVYDRNRKSIVTVLHAEWLQ